MNSIEYLEKEYNENKGFLGSSNFEQAKEMHKQEMKQLSQQEISDEEIEKGANELSQKGVDIDYTWIMGAKWYREQLKQRQ
jgi:uncharacterized linocin/CFP29 family protein